MSAYFALLALVASAWLLVYVLGRVHRIGGSQVGPARAGALALAAFGALAKVFLAVAYVAGVFGASIESHSDMWATADHLSTAMLLVAVGMMVHGGFRVADHKARTRRPPRKASSGELARVGR